MRKRRTEDGNRTGPPGGTEKVKGKEENYEIICSDAPRPRWIYRVHATTIKNMNLKAMSFKSFVS